VLSTQKDSLYFAKSDWYITRQSAYADLTGLQDLPKVKLQQSESITKKGDDTYVDVKLKNPSDHLAFMVYLDMKKKESNESVVPVFWDDNYITLLPGEERIVSGHCHTADLEGEDADVIVSGWNIE
jgi:exo-1,4-beta-D-glucosaminidase